MNIPDAKIVYFFQTFSKCNKESPNLIARSVNLIQIEFKFLQTIDGF